ncbi:MAG: hypothetical protein WCG25_07790 [bacterium]
MIMQVGITLFVLGIMADLIAKNRFLIEENLKMMKDMKYDPVTRTGQDK